MQTDTQTKLDRQTQTDRQTNTEIDRQTNTDIWRTIHDGPWKLEFLKKPKRIIKRLIKQQRDKNSSTRRTYRDTRC